MILCQCNAVTERKIRRAIDNGAACVDTIGAACGAGTRCGGCQPWLESMLADREHADMTPA